MLVLLVTVVAVVAVGMVWRWRQGRLRAVPPGVVLSVALRTELGVSLGEQGALVQFSSAFCQPCRATRRVLAGVTDSVPGVTYVDVDAESHLDAVRALNIASTPTTLILDPDGRERFRATGIPRPEQVRAALRLTAGIADGAVR